MESELRKNIRNRWLFSLFEFAHLEFQRRLWVEADYPESIGDYTEAICQYFDDLNLDNGYDDFIQQEIITREEFAVIIDFHNQLNSYVERPEKKSLSDKNILKDVEWINLTLTAKKNWNKLKNIISDSNELNYMETLEKKYL